MVALPSEPGKDRLGHLDCTNVSFVEVRACGDAPALGMNIERQVEAQSVIAPVVTVSKCGFFNFSRCKGFINGGQTVFQEILLGVVPEAIADYPLDEESMIPQCDFNIINSLKQKIDIMVGAEYIIDIPVPTEYGLPKSSFALRGDDLPYSKFESIRGSNV